MPIKPHDCNLCGKKSTCNLSTSSRNACLLERTLSKEELESLDTNKNADEACSTILLPTTASNKKIIHFEKSQRPGRDKSV